VYSNVVTDADYIDYYTFFINYNNYKNDIPIATYYVYNVYNIYIIYLLECACARAFTVYIMHVEWTHIILFIIKYIFA
jgi:hypothetical protein